MIEVKTIKDFSDESKEGKLLLAALSILTSLDIDENKWGGMTHPDDALRRVADIANKIYYEEKSAFFRSLGISDVNRCSGFGRGHDNNFSNGR